MVGGTPKRFAEEDERKRQEVQTRNSAENAAYAAEKMLNDNAENIPEDLKNEVQGKIAAVRSALQNDDIARIETTLNELQESLQAVGQAVYSQAGAGAGPGQPPPPGADAGPSSGPDDDNTVDGEFPGGIGLRLAERQTTGQAICLDKGVHSARTMCSRLQ